MTQPQALIAPDSWKGTFSALEVAEAIGRGFDGAGWAIDLCPLGDGGEGTVEALLEHRAGRWIAAPAHDPLGRAIEAGFAVLDQPAIAVVEAASASGLPRVERVEREPERASTFGTGELIVAAATRADLVLVAVGGTASTDGGSGALDAIAAAGGIGSACVVCLCDVRTPWERAASTFAPQKGADRAVVRRLDARLHRIAERLPRDPRGRPMTGAGGGLAGGLWARLDAELVPGADWVLDFVRFAERAVAAALIVTGEGRLDQTTAEGKVVARVARRARLIGRTVDGIVGIDACTADERAALGLRRVYEAETLAAIEAAGGKLAERARQDSNL